MDIAEERVALAGQGLTIVEREAWGAVGDYSSRRPVAMPAVYLFLHISVTLDAGDLPADEHEAMRVIESIGEQRFGIGFPYNAAAFDTGRLYEGQPLCRRGAHTVNDLPNHELPAGSLNHVARALVLPQMTTDDVTAAQLDAAARWGAAQIRAGLAIRRAQWFGHRDVTRKSCPGPIAYAQIPALNRLTRRYELAGLPAPTNLEEPMIVLAPGGSAFLLEGGKLVHIAAEDTLAGAPATVPRWPMKDNRTWLNMQAAYPVVKTGD